MKYMLYFFLLGNSGRGAGTVASGGGSIFSSKNSIFSGADIFLGFPLLFFENSLVDVLLPLANMHWYQLVPGITTSLAS